MFELPPTTPPPPEPTPGPLAARLREALPGWMPRPRLNVAVPAAAPAPDGEAPNSGEVQKRPPRSRRRPLAVGLKKAARRARRAAGAAAFLAVAASGGAFSSSDGFGIGLGVSVSVAAEQPLLAAVSRRDFQLTVAPLNSAARGVDSADLYVAGDPAGGWTRVGPCQAYVRDGLPVFIGAVRVPEDGFYFFTSTAEPDASGNPQPPPPAARPQARVLVDTRPPRVAFDAPARDLLESPGESLPLAWSVVEEHPAPDPATLSMSTDGGESWRTLRRALPARGGFEWTADGVPGTYIFRLQAHDLAGNIGEDRVEITVRPALEAPAPPPPATQSAEDGPMAPSSAPLASADASAPEQAPGGQVVRVPRAAPETEPVPARIAWVEYLKAANHIRQGRPTDALRHYWLAVDADPDFMEAWMDMARVYKELARFGPAREALAQAESRATDHPELLHLRGEIPHAEGMLRLSVASTPDERLAARALIDVAVRHYAAALEAARVQWKLPQMAPTYYRLGEICYYVNHDADGARLYWRKILDLATPTPDPDAFLPDADAFDPSGASGDSTIDPDEAAIRRHERRLAFRYTKLKDSLDNWQHWARALVSQLDARQRAGLTVLGRGPQSSRPGADGRPGTGTGAGAGLSPSSVYELLPDLPPGGGDGTLAARGLSGSASPLLSPETVDAWRRAAEGDPVGHGPVRFRDGVGVGANPDANAPRGTWGAATGRPPEGPVDSRWPDDERNLDVAEAATGVASTSGRPARAGVALGGILNAEPVLSPSAGAGVSPMTPIISPNPSGRGAGRSGPSAPGTATGPAEYSGGAPAPTAPWLSPGYGSLPGR